VLAAALALALAACKPVVSAGPPLPVAPPGVEAGSVLVDTNPDPAITDYHVIDMPDPFVMAVDPSYCDHGAGPPAACYYAYTTQVYFNQTPVYRSSDLTHWEYAGVDNGDPDPWPDGGAKGNIAPWASAIGHWAPSVLFRPNQPLLRPDLPRARYVMWYTATSLVPGSAGYKCLGVAVADSPDGPFIDNETTPAYCQTALGGTIDPSTYVDSTGTAYLLYKSDGNSGASTPSRLWSSQLTPDGRMIVPGTEHLLLEVDHTPSNWEQPIIEAPSLVNTPAGLFLFYSAYYWESTGYKVAVARCDSPAGPCRRVYKTPLLATRGAMLGPGGQTPFVDRAGNWWLAFHAWTAPLFTYGSGGRRSMRILPLTFPVGAPKVG
jgi:beta-xylosidase